MELWAGLRSGAMNTLKVWTILKAMLAVLLLSVTAPSFAVMQAMDDQALSQETGQAAFFTSYNGPSGSGTGATPSDFGFFTLGLNGTVQLNTNIQHLQLGCGGVNGPGCDIDISNASLSGNPGVGSCPAGASPASCDAVLTNPFIQLAIKNPTSLSTRQLVGFNLGAQNAVGLLQTGSQPTGSLSSSPNGISTISGYMQVQSAVGSSNLTGTVSTLPGFMNGCNASVNGGGGAACQTIDASATAAAGTQYQIKGNLNGPLGVVAGFVLVNGGFWIPGFTGVNFNVSTPTIVNGNRITQLTVNPDPITLPNIYLGNNQGNDSCNCNLSPGPNQPTTGNNYPNSALSYPASGGSVGTQGGPVSSYVNSCSPGFTCFLAGQPGGTFTTYMYGLISGVTAKVAFNQPLGYMHVLPINSPLSLSLQSQSVLWPGSPAADVAQPGWWLGMSNPIILGNLVPSSSINLCTSAASSSTCAYPQIATAVNAYLAANPPTSSSLSTLWAILTNGTLGVQISTNAQPLNMSGSPIALTLNGLQLNSQFTTSNCYGSLKFC
ncbi:MAG: hypothetical protein KGO49_13765 [Gammaproteobacteria bacterium]|nr:hypothetical protein [Gammaproteobacteria bacterium]